MDEYRGRVNTFCRGKSLLLELAEGLISRCLSVILLTEQTGVFKEVWTSYLTKRNLPNKLC